MMCRVVVAVPIWESILVHPAARALRTTLFISSRILLTVTTCHTSTLIFPMTTSRSAFQGPSRKLVLAFDVGTTYSGISYRYANLQTEGDGRYSLIDP